MASENKPPFKPGHFSVKLRRQGLGQHYVGWSQRYLCPYWKLLKSPSPIPASHGLRSCSYQGLVRKGSSIIPTGRDERAWRRLRGLVRLPAPVTPLRSRRARAARAVTLGSAADPWAVLEGAHQDANCMAVEGFEDEEKTKRQ